MLKEFIQLTAPGGHTIYIRPEDIWCLDYDPDDKDTHIVILKQGVSEDYYVKETPGVIFDLCNKVRDAAFNPNANPYRSIR